MSLSIYQLRMYAKKWLKENYNMELLVPLELNGRLKTACGRFIYTKYRNGSKPNTPEVVEMNKYFVENNEPVVVLDVLRHELVHYALFMQGIPHEDGKPTFERELKRLGVVSQSTIDKYSIKSKPTRVSVYKCIMPNCGREYKTKRALRGDGAFHRCKCGGTLQSLGKREVSA